MVSALTEQLRTHYEPGIRKEIPYNGELLIHDVARSVRKNPHRTAIDFLGGTLTYKELLEHIELSAGYLRTLGIKADDRVSLILPNCPQFIIGYYATLAIGAIVVAHNPLAPAKELKHQIENAGSKVALVWENCIDKVNGSKAQLVAVNLAHYLPTVSKLLMKLPVKTAQEKRDQMRKAVATGIPYFEKPYGAPVRVSDWAWDRDPDKPAILLHTGGTTGTPKAVMLSNKNLYTNIAAAVEWMSGLSYGKETVYAILPFFHAFGLNLTLNGFMRLAATAVLLPKFDEGMFLNAQKRRPCTFMLGVPPMFDRIEKVASKQGSDLSSIKCTVTGAMPISAEIASRWEAITGSFVVEGYGMTETAPIICGSPYGNNRRPGTLGIAFPDVDVRMVDPDNPSRDVDHENGEAGELVVKGPNCTPGYWNNEDETQVLYTKDGWLRTGDIVVQKDGFLVMADRTKELIISGGFNIYPSEVERAIVSMPEVTDCAVIGLPDEGRGEEVVAAIVLNPGASITLSMVREWAEQSLSHYALPRSIEIVRDLPRSQLGKTLRRTVREQILAARELIASATERIRPTEERESSAAENPGEKQTR
ncbi:MAG: AMP-binding protein [Actinomycetaceae bacterium]|nr:AMP-binding protein [Actinomycetaceae bacterium]